MLFSFDKKQKADAIFLQFGFCLALFNMSSATGLTEEGCDYARLSVNINGDIQCGNVYPLSSVGDAVPKVTYSSAVDGNQYTVVMIDPDAPSRANPKYRSWLHYLAVNVQGRKLKTAIHLDALSPTVDYNPPSPPKDSGLHRYIIYVMQQSGSVSLGSFSSRASFDVESFRSKHVLTPVASNMFKTERK